MIHIGNSPVSGFLSTEKKEAIKVELEKWKFRNDQFKSTVETDKLFWILCEYDHSNAPSNWEIENEHWNSICCWVKWFTLNHPEEIPKVIEL